jgi:hypothetical protein
MNTQEKGKAFTESLQRFVAETEALQRDFAFFQQTLYGLFGAKDLEETERWLSRVEDHWRAGLLSILHEQGLIRAPCFHWETSLYLNTVDAGSFYA